MIFKKEGYPGGIFYIDNTILTNVFNILRFICLLLAGVVLFTLQPAKNYYRVIFTFLSLQLIYIAIAKSTYNDTTNTVMAVLLNERTDETINMEEFFSVSLFDEIKEEINYNDERVAAYGFHPSVLYYNGFVTLDGYESVHTMDYQAQFREIIAPALDRYPNWRDYYDNWGGTYVFVW